MGSILLFHRKRQTREEHGRRATEGGQVGEDNSAACRPGDQLTQTQESLSDHVNWGRSEEQMTHVMAAALRGSSEGPPAQTNCGLVSKVTFPAL